MDNNKKMPMQQDKNTEQIQPQFDTSASNFQPISGSEIPETKQTIPIGVYIIIAWCVMGAIYSFFNNFEGSFLISAVIILNLFLAIGLAFRLNLARKIMVWALGANIVLLALAIVFLSAVNTKFNNAKAEYESLNAKINNSMGVDITIKEQLRANQAQLDSLSKQLGKSLKQNYIFGGIEITTSIAAIVYLSLPGIKDKFRDLDN
jgi:hypothetical protein